jgi:hypothetical protein
MTRRYVSYLFYPEQIDSPEFFESFSTDGHYRVDPGFDTREIPQYFKNPHYVFSMFELIMYIEFCDKLFDYKKHVRKWHKQERSNDEDEHPQTLDIPGDEKNDFENNERAIALERAIRNIEDRFGKPRM